MKLDKEITQKMSKIDEVLQKAMNINVVTGITGAPMSTEAKVQPKGKKVSHKEPASFEIIIFRNKNSSKEIEVWLGEETKDLCSAVKI